MLAERAYVRLRAGESAAAQGVCLIGARVLFHAVSGLCMRRTMTSDGKTHTRARGFKPDGTDREADQPPWQLLETTGGDRFATFFL